MKLYKLKKFNKDDYIFFPSVILLLVFLIMIQINIWSGDYGYSNLQDLKEEFKEKEQLTLELERSNLLLEQEKERLRSERNAIEGLARYELGLIKSGETFYKFQSELTKDKEIDPKISNQDYSYIL